MKRVSFLYAVPLLGLLSLGCGNPNGGTGGATGPQTAAPAQASQETATTDPAGATGTSNVAAKLPMDLTPQDVVGKFLDALRSGDEKIAAELLTTKARTETAKHDLTVQPPGTPRASYRVGQVEYVTEQRDGAHVTSIWSEPTEAGGAESYQIVWVLRLQPHGWRIAGMATEVVPGQAPLFLNFEDPADMLQKWQTADAELSGRDPAAVQQAQQPAAAGTYRQ